MKDPKNVHITAEDVKYMEEVEQELFPRISMIERAKSFKIGDFLIVKTCTFEFDLTGDVMDDEPKLKVLRNSYGAPIKYVVVALDKNGMAFIKRVNKSGIPHGRVSSCMGMEDDDYARANNHFVFELDPDFADSLLLEDDYDPASLHRNKKDIWKAVTEHNKKHKIPTKELYDVVSFFRTVNPGDTLWTSNINSIFIKDKKDLVPAEYNKTCKYNMTTRIKSSIVTILTIVDKKGVEKNVPPDFFWSKALYRERPRTYKELNI